MQMLQSLPVQPASLDGAAPQLTVQIGNQPAFKVALPADLLPTPVTNGTIPSGTTDTTPIPAPAPGAVLGEPAPAALPGFVGTITSEIAAVLDQRAIATLREAVPAAATTAVPDVAAAVSAGPVTAAPATPVTDPEMATLSATIALPNGQELRARVVLPRPATTGGFKVARAEKFAAGPGAISVAGAADKSPQERNFLTAGKEEVEQPDQADGITVAIAEPVMTATLFERQSAAEKSALSFTLSDHTEFAVTADSAFENLQPTAMAHRAVAAVVSAVEAQTVSRLQPAPSVHLKLNLNGEDLSIKVQLRDGEVRTEFQTASPELRSAIAREWQSVGVESPTRVLRYLEPVYGSAGAGDQGTSSSGQQGQSSSQYGRPSAHDVFGSVGRAYPFRESEAEASARVELPSFQPTSLHLSAVA